MSKKVVSTRRPLTRDQAFARRRRQKLARRAASALLVVSLFALVIGLSAFANSQEGQAQVGQSNSSSSASASRPGRPAITPRVMAARAFSEDDARRFAASYKMVREAGRTTAHRIIRAQFMTSKEAATLLNTTIGVADNDQVCVVEMDGGKMTAPGTSATGNFTVSYLVFDGQSGNLLVESMR